jgi:hypothetical protein
MSLYALYKAWNAKTGKDANRGRWRNSCNAVRCGAVRCDVLCMHSVYRVDSVCLMWIVCTVNERYPQRLFFLSFFFLENVVS